MIVLDSNNSNNDLQVQQQEHNEILFWKLFHNKYLRYLIFNHLQTMEIEFSNLSSYYLGNRIPLRYINHLNWYLERDSKRSLLIDRLLYDSSNLIIQKDDIIKLINEEQQQQQQQNDSNSITVLKLLYNKYPQQMNQIDLILKSLELNSIQSFKLFTQIYNDIPISNESIDCAFLNSKLDIADNLIQLQKQQQQQQQHLCENVYFNNSIFKQLNSSSSFLNNNNNNEIDNIIKYLINHPELYFNLSSNNQEYQYPIIETKLFLSLNNESLQIELLKKNLVIREPFNFVNENDLKINETVFTFLESYCRLQILLINQNIRNYFILKTLQNKEATTTTKLISYLNDFGIKNLQIKEFIEINIKNEKLIELLLIESFQDFKFYFKNVFNSKIIKSMELLIIPLKKLFTIDEKVELIEMIMVNGMINTNANIQFINLIINLLYPLNGFKSFYKSLNLYKKLIKFNYTTLKTNFYLIIKSYYIEKIILNFETSNLKKIFNLIGEDLELFNIFENFNQDIKFSINNYFNRNCIDNEDNIIEYIQILFKIYYNSNSTFSINSLIKQFTLFKIIKEQQPNHLYSSSTFGKIQLIINNFKNQKLYAIECLDLLLNHNDFLNIEYTLSNITDSILINWFIANENRFKKLIINNSLLEIVIIQKHQPIITFQNVFKHLLKQGGNNQSTYIAPPTLIKSIINYYKENINNIEIVYNCKEILKLVYINHNLFYWDSNLFKNGLLPTFGLKIDSFYDSIILNILNQDVNPKINLGPSPFSMKPIITNSTTTTYSQLFKVSNKSLPIPTPTPTSTVTSAFSIGLSFGTTSLSSNCDDGLFSGISNNKDQSLFKTKPKTPTTTSNNQLLNVNKSLATSTQTFSTGLLLGSTSLSDRLFNDLTISNSNNSNVPFGTYTMVKLSPRLFEGEEEEEDDEDKCEEEEQEVYVCSGCNTIYELFKEEEDEQHDDNLQPILDSFKYKDLSALVGFGKVKQAIEWLKLKPIKLSNNQVEIIIKYYDLDLIKDYFNSIKSITHQVTHVDIIDNLYLLITSLKNNRFDVFDFLIEYFNIKIDNSTTTNNTVATTTNTNSLIINEVTFQNIIEHCSNDFNLEAVDYLLNHRLFKLQFSNSTNVISSLIKSSLATNNILLVNYLFDSHKITQSNQFQINKCNSIPFINNLNLLKNKQ